MLDIIVIFLLISGLIFFTGGAVGILRLPDFYTRLHPAGKMDTLGSLLMVLAVALFNLHDFTWAQLITSLKIMLIVLFVFVLSPTATHAIVDAGVRAGLKPWTKEKR
ncbi:MAG: monovalent cation/H(+) antiporter subunit G [Candidatus Desulfacyla sp.]